MAYICGCGGQLARIHRTLQQKLVCEAVYRCRRCGELKRLPRPFMFYFQQESACPLCGTRRLTRLNSPDHIDSMRWNLFSLLRHFMAMQLYHCRFCRIQFYGRPLENKNNAAASR